ncbi:MAG TPA: dephospho-CoA kinase [Methylophilus sp.]
MNVVALTGGIGSGKSAATQAFTSLGVPVVDVDVISHQLTAAGAPLVQQIAAAFGPDYVTPEQALNRPAMRELVFNDAAARATLNAILHPAIHEEALKQLALQPDAPYQVLVIPLLFESNRYQASIDHILLIDCDEALQIKRVMQRSGLSQAQVENILRAQVSRQQRIDGANTIIVNDGDLQNLQQKIAEFHKNYINTCIVSK